MNRSSILAYFPKITLKRYRDLLGLSREADDVWKIGRAQLATLGWGEDLIHSFLSWQKVTNPDILHSAREREGIDLIGYDDQRYPPLLKQIYDPPVALFVRGQLPATPTSVAIVGTRAMTPYGNQVTEEITRSLATHGVTIVSGLALGIDGVAHRATLAVSGYTIAVLGTGVNRAHVYPSEHRRLADDIVHHGGAVISEYPPGARSTSFSFPRRNRIIAGLANATVVIEAPESSGALITAQCALDANRDVFAVPQNITSPTAAGVHLLIKTGAHPVTGAHDILSMLHIPDRDEGDPATTPGPPLSPAEHTIISLIDRVPAHIDVLIKQSTLPPAVVMSTLTLLEMKGLVRNLGAMMYVRS